MDPCWAPSVFGFAHECTEHPQELWLELNQKLSPGWKKQKPTVWPPFYPKGCRLAQNRMKLSTYIVKTVSPHSQFWWIKLEKWASQCQVCVCVSLSVLVADLPRLAVQLACVFGRSRASKEEALTDMCSDCCLCQSTGCYTFLLCALIEFNSFMLTTEEQISNHLGQD